MDKKHIIGVVGMPGAGKATVRNIAESKAYAVVIMGDEIREETKKRGLEPTPENIGQIMLKMREEEGPTAVAKRCIAKIQNAKTRIVFVDGVRSLDEVNEFKKHFASVNLIAVHSSPETRFQRLSRRKRSDDPKGWDVFCERDLRELSVGQGDVIALADWMIVNERTYEEFKAKVGEVVEAAFQKWRK
ncbi:MAG TPA: AAA family ATPase [Candidatus Bathyarchaeia archaeon]|nr:AAA family ATPase [Candidatus Bathyarchaeia archaeon]